MVHGCVHSFSINAAKFLVIVVSTHSEDSHNMVAARQTVARAKNQKIKETKEQVTTDEQLQKHHQQLEIDWINHCLMFVLFLLGA